MIEGTHEVTGMASQPDRFLTRTELALALKVSLRTVDMMLADVLPGRGEFNKRFHAGAVAGKVGAVLFARCVAGVEGEGKDVETECGEQIVTTDGHGCEVASCSAAQAARALRRG